jgi:signal transduction histidine kinase
MVLHYFATQYVFYCILIPVTVFQTALIGIILLALGAVPEAVMTGNVGVLGRAVFGNVTIFAILLCGRYIANRSWEGECAASSLQSDFVCAVSHEFRTRLTTICLLTEQLSTEKITDEGGRSECYQMLERDSHRLGRLVEGLLEFVVMESGAAKYDVENIDPGELIRQVAHDFSARNEITGSPG